MIHVLDLAVRTLIRDHPGRRPSPVDPAYSGIPVPCSPHDRTTVYRTLSSLSGHRDTAVGSRLEAERVDSGAGSALQGGDGLLGGGVEGEDLVEPDHLEDAHLVRVDAGEAER